LEKAADGAGISDKTLRRAKTALGVVAERTASPGTVNGRGGCPNNRCSIDRPKVASNPYDGHTKTMGALANLGHLRGNGCDQ
jgi:hypothetical protein